MLKSHLPSITSIFGASVALNTYGTVSKVFSLVLSNLEFLPETLGAQVFEVRSHGEQDDVVGGNAR